MPAPIELHLDAIDVPLRDGRRVTVRTVRAENRDKFQAAVRSLSAESSYYRFFSPMRELSPKLLERATHPEPERELQLVAVSDEEPQDKIVGGARYIAITGTRDCEFSIVIVDGWQGVGLASRLMRELIEAARERGLRRMEGFVLAGNTGMLDLARRLGFTVITDPHDVTVKVVRLDLLTGIKAPGSAAP